MPAAASNKATTAKMPNIKRLKRRGAIMVASDCSIVLTLEADDVIHSFWVPNLHGKKDLIPGRTATVGFRADVAGTYRGQCAEFCGYQHANMALLIVADKENSLLISGTGDVIEPEHDLLAIGSGGAYAQAAAQALYENTELDARAIVEKALGIAGKICIYTNTSITIEEL